MPRAFLRRTSYVLPALVALSAAGCGNVLGYDKIKVDDDAGADNAGGAGGDSGGTAGSGGEPTGGAGGAAGDPGAGGSAGTAGSAGAGGTGGQMTGPTTAPLAANISISEVAIYQGVSVPLFKGGQTVTKTNAPIVQLRDALVRVFVQPGSGWQAHGITAQLDLSNSGGTLPSVTVNASPTGASTESSLASTLNFLIPAAQLTGDLSIAVSLHEGDVNATPGAASGAAWPDNGTYALGARTSNGAFHLYIVPFSYNNQVPDLGQAQLDVITNYFRGTYPFADVDVQVDTRSHKFSQQFSAQGSGWSELLDQTCAIRSQDNPNRNVYYYGVLRPTSSFDQYCGNGCIAGLANLSYNRDDDSSRCSIGLVFGANDSYYTPKDAAGTALQEVAHSLGRLHAPCGGPDNIDPSWPSSYSNASIGVFGWDLTSNTLKSPSKYTDFMSYCQDNVWISDYTYSALFSWGAYVNSLARVINAPARRPFRVVLEGASGDLRWGSTRHLESPTGIAVDATALAADGAALGSVTLQWHGYSTLRGGTYLVPPELPVGATSLRLPDGRTLSL